MEKTKTTNRKIENKKSVYLSNEAQEIIEIYQAKNGVNSFSKAIDDLIKLSNEKLETLINISNETREREERIATGIERMIAITQGNYKAVAIELSLSNDLISETLIENGLSDNETILKFSSYEKKKLAVSKMFKASRDL